MSSVAPPKRRFVGSFITRDFFGLHPTDPRESSGPKTNGHTVSRQYLLIRKLNKKRKKLAKISFSARGFARSLPDNTTGVLRTQRSLMRGFASFSPAAFSRLLPSVSIKVRKAKTEKRRALFTSERLICCPREIIPPAMDDVCVFDWLKRGQEKGNCVLSLATTA